MIKLGVLNAGPVLPEIRHIYSDYAQIFGHMLRCFDFQIESWKVYESHFPNTITQCDAWLISGSKFGVYENHPWIPTLEEFIRDCHANNLPLIGVCFGHQIIAQALGGTVEKFREGWGVGWAPFFFLDQTIYLNSWHQDQVVIVPEGAHVLGHNSFCENAFISYGENTFSLQAHPEFDHDFIRHLIKYRGSEVPQKRVQGAKESLEKKLSNDLMRDFFGYHIKSRSLQQAIENFSNGQ